MVNFRRPIRLADKLVSFPSIFKTFLSSTISLCQLSISESARVGRHARRPDSQPTYDTLFSLDSWWPPGDLFTGGPIWKALVLHLQPSTNHAQLCSWLYGEAHQGLQQEGYLGLGTGYYLYLSLLLSKPFSFYMFLYQLTCHTQHPIPSGFMAVS